MSERGWVGMKILHSADWHIGNFPGPEQEGKNLRALDTVKCIRNLHNTAQRELPDVILIAGDLFHQARVWADRGLSEVNTAIEAIEELSQICPVIVMRGTPNHDGSEQFEMLRARFSKTNTNVYIITEPRGIRITIDDGKVAAICMLPGFDKGVYRAKLPGLSKEEENIVFTEELGKAISALKAANYDADINIFMSHYTVPGCNLESGQTQFFSQFEPVILPEVLDAAGFDLVCLGHIHRPQKLESCRNTFYSGAINATSFNDESQERGFWIHELEASLPYDKLVDSRFITSPIREFMTLRMDDDAIQAFNNSGAFIYGAETTGGIKDKIVRVIYSCTDETNKAFNRALMEKRLYDEGAFWVSEISPEQITISTNKNELSDVSNRIERPRVAQNK